MPLTATTGGRRTISHTHQIFHQAVHTPLIENISACMTSLFLSQVLRESQSATAPSTLRVTGLSSLRLHLQTVAADTNEGQASRQAWALQCIYELAPAAGAHVHRLLGPAATRALDHSQIQVLLLLNACQGSAKTLFC